MIRSGGLDVFGAVPDWQMVANGMVPPTGDGAET